MLVDSIVYMQIEEKVEKQVAYQAVFNSRHDKRNLDKAPPLSPLVKLLCKTTETHSYHLSDFPYHKDRTLPSSSCVLSAISRRLPRSKTGCYGLGVDDCDVAAHLLKAGCRV